MELISNVSVIFDLKECITFICNRFIFLLIYNHSISTNPKYLVTFIKINTILNHGIFKIIIIISYAIYNLNIFLYFEMRLNILDSIYAIYYLIILWQYKIIKKKKFKRSNKIFIKT